MDKARFNLRTLFSSPLNRRQMLTKVAPIGAAGAMLGTFAPIAHAQEQHSVLQDPALAQPREFYVPNFQVTGFRFAYRYISADAGTSNDDTFTLNNLGGATIFASTALTEISAHGTSNPINAWAYFSAYSDSTGVHQISGQTTTALIVTGATSLTVKTHAYSAFVGSLTTVWFYQ